MTTIINANNTGITQTVDTSGILQIQTANTAAITIDASQNITCNSTGAITVSVGTTAQRPSSPANGMIRYNSTLACFEVYANNTWALSNVTPPPTNTVAPVISGTSIVGQTLTTTNGTWSFSPTGYYYQWRANAVAISSNATSNTFVLTSTQLGANITCNVTAYNAAGNSTPATSNSLGPVTSSYTVSYVIVAGGGGGAGGQDFVRYSGGGGGGMQLIGTANVTPSTVYTFVVGGGGGGGGTASAGGSGTASTGFGLTATGGNGSPGGPGGAAQTNSGAGGDAGNPGGNGGAGTYNSINGTSTPRAGGGGGSRLRTDLGLGYGGAGGGGNGGPQNGGGSAGSANTGGGGGGGDATNQPGGSGGSGIVIISIPTSSYSGVQSGASVTTSGSNTILTYTSSGTYTG